MPKKRVWKAKLVEGLQPIMIDLDVYKAIEAGRGNFTEAPNTILRRLLGVDHPRTAAAPSHANGTAKNGSAAASGGPEKIQHDREMVLPDGAELRAAYCGVTVTGAIREGIWEVDGSKFNLPSAELIASVHSHAETQVDLNGWQHWEVRLPGAESWRPLADL